MAKKKIPLRRTEKKKASRRTKAAPSDKTILNKLKRKPKEPERGYSIGGFILYKDLGGKTTKEEYEPSGYTQTKKRNFLSIKELLDIIGDVDLDEVGFSGSYLDIDIYCPEKEESFSQREEAYLKAKERWDKWYYENEERIKEIKKQEKERIRREKEAELQKLKAEQERIRKELEGIYD